MLLTIILILIFINSVISFLNPQSMHIFGCGLTGFASNDGKKANPVYLFLIAASNADRGTDACGMFINNKRIPGIDKEADIRKFLQNHHIQYAPNCKNKNIMIHNRKKSYGGTDAEHCHPFLVEDRDNSLVLQHNGTITNIKELCTKYNIQYTPGDVDSKKLCDILFQSENFNVLDEYEGGAALMFCKKEEPNVMYVYKGESRAYSYAHYETEERPLFFLELPEGIYFSSTAQPLDVIANGQKHLRVYSLSANKVYRIEKNQFTMIQKIDRSKINEPFRHVTHRNHTPSKQHAITKSSKNFLNFKDKLENIDLWLENFYAGVGSITRSNLLSFITGRYYTYINTKQLRADELETLCAVDLECNESEMSTLDGVHAVFATSNQFCYFVKSITDSSETAPRRIFFDGVLIESNKTKQWTKKNMANRLTTLKGVNVYEYLKQLSAYSKDPIFPTYLEAEEMSMTSNIEPCWFYRGKPLFGNAIFQPNYCYRQYTIELGDVVRIDTERQLDYILVNKHKRNFAKTKPNSHEVSDDDFFFNYDDEENTQQESSENKQIAMPFSLSNNLKIMYYSHKLSKNIRVTRIMNNDDEADLFGVLAMEEIMFFDPDITYKIETNDFSVEVVGKEIIDNIAIKCFNLNTDTTYARYPYFREEFDVACRNDLLKNFIEGICGIKDLDKVVEEIVVDFFFSEMAHYEQVNSINVMYD